MKDRDMTNVKVIFKKSDLIQGKVYYYFKDITQPSNKITMSYIASLGNTTPSREYVYKGCGGWNYFLTLNEEQFNKMQNEVTRLGGKVEILK